METAAMTSGITASIEPKTTASTSSAASPPIRPSASTPIPDLELPPLASSFRLVAWITVPGDADERTRLASRAAAGWLAPPYTRARAAVPFAETSSRSAPVR